MVVMIIIALTRDASLTMQIDNDYYNSVEKKERTNVSTIPTLRHVMNLNKKTQVESYIEHANSMSYMFHPVVSSFEEKERE